MSNGRLDTPAPNVIFIRSVFYGIAAGGLNGAIWGVTIGAADCGLGCLLIGLPAFGIGAPIGGVVGVVLGIVVLLAGTLYDRRPRILQAVVAAIAMAMIFLTLWLLTQKPPLSISVLVLMLPAGAAAWFLLPLVLRPETREPMPRPG